MLFASTGFPRTRIQQDLPLGYTRLIGSEDIHDNGVSARMFNLYKPVAPDGQRLCSLSNYFQEKNQMKKFAICCVALFVVAMLVPSAQAATKCYHLTNFCDQVQVSQFTVGGVQKTEVVGLWDFVCLNVGTGTLVSGGPNKVGTQPAYPYVGGVAFGANANFTFNPSLGLFDLYGTSDGMTTFAFQTAQPFTKTNGACNPLSPNKKQGLRPTLNR